MLPLKLAICPDLHRSTARPLIFRWPTPKIAAAHLPAWRRDAATAGCDMHMVLSAFWQRTKLALIAVIGCSLLAALLLASRRLQPNSSGCSTPWSDGASSSKAALLAVIRGCRLVRRSCAAGARRDIDAHHSLRIFGTSRRSACGIPARRACTRATRLVRILGRSAAMSDFKPDATRMTTTPELTGGGLPPSRIFHLQRQAGRRRA